MTETLPAGAGILVTRTLRKEKAVSNQTANRYAGFMKYLEDSGIKDSYRIVDLEMKDDDEALNIGLLAGIFDGHPHIKAAVTFNSKVYRLAMHIKSLGKTGISLLGYDLPERNVAYLHDGTVSHLIGQRPEKQAYCAVSDMCRVLIFGQQVNRINYMPIDILIKENIDYYLNFKD